MKTNRLLHSAISARRLLCGVFVGAMTMSLFTVGCTKNVDPPVVDPVDPGVNIINKKDTVTLVDTTLVFGIERLSLSCVAGEQEIGFEPFSDWTLVASADAPSWFKVLTASGTKDDKVLKFNLEAFDVLGGSREAKAVFTVGGEAKDVTFVQHGTPRYINVYDVKMVFNEKKTYGTIQYIVTNVEPELVSFPTWMESAVLAKDPSDESRYVIHVKLKYADFDDALRTGSIVLCDKNFKDFIVELPIECEQSVSAYLAATTFDINKPFPGNKSDDIRKGSFSVAAKPGAEDFLVFFYDVDAGAGGSVIKNPSTWVTVTGAVAPADAYAKKTFDFSLPEFNRGAKTRVSACFALPLSETENGLPKTEGELPNIKPILPEQYRIFSITQNKFKRVALTDLEGMENMYKGLFVKCATGVGPQFKPGLSVQTTHTVKIRMASGLKPKLEVQKIAAMAGRPPMVAATPEFNWYDGVGTLPAVVGKGVQGEPVLVSSDEEYDYYTIELNCKPVTYGVVAKFDVRVWVDGETFVPSDLSTIGDPMFILEYNDKEPVL